MYSTFLIITILRVFISIIKWIWIVFTLICLVGAINDASRKYEEKIFSTKTDTNSSDSETDETETEFEEDDEDNTETRWNHFVTALHLKKEPKKEEKKEPEIKKPPFLLKIARYLRYVIVIGYLALHNYYDIPSVISFVFGIYIGKELFMSKYINLPTTLLSPNDADYIINLKDLKSVEKMKHFFNQPHYKEIKEKIIKSLNIHQLQPPPLPSLSAVTTPTTVNTPSRNRDNGMASTPSHRNNNKEFNIDGSNLAMKSSQSTNPLLQQQQQQTLPTPNITPTTTTTSTTSNTTSATLSTNQNASNQSENNNKKSNILLLPPPIKPPPPHAASSVTNTPAKDNNNNIDASKAMSVSKNSNNPAMQRLNSIGSPITRQTPALAKKQNMIVPHINRDVVLAEIERVQKLYGSKPFMLDIIKYVKEKRR